MYSIQLSIVIVTLLALPQFCLAQMCSDGQDSPIGVQGDSGEYAITFKMGNLSDAEERVEVLYINAKDFHSVPQSENDETRIDIGVTTEWQEPLEVYMVTDRNLYFFTDDCLIGGDKKCRAKNGWKVGDWPTPRPNFGDVHRTSSWLASDSAGTPLNAQEADNKSDAAEELLGKFGIRASDVCEGTCPAGKTCSPTKIDNASGDGLSVPTPSCSYHPGSRVPTYTCRYTASVATREFDRRKPTFRAKECKCKPSST